MHKNIIPAQKVVQKIIGSEYIEEYVKELLPVIQDEINRVIDIEEKKHIAVVELPTCFDIPNMSNAKAQMHVYFHVIKSLKKSGYFPKLEIIGNNSENQRVYLYIKWHSKDDIEMEKYMNSYIKAHILDSSRHTKKEKLRRRRT